MLITHRLNLDMQNHGGRQTVYVKQGDALSRAVELWLYDNGAEWIVPEDAVLRAVAYCKPDGTKGLYEHLPDGGDAISVSESKVTVQLAPQMLTVGGFVACELRLSNENGSQLTTFTWWIFVAESMTEILSEDYYNFPSLQNLSSAMGDLSNLDTAAKSSLVAAINELAQDGLIARLASSITASDGPGVIDLGAPESPPFLRAVVPAISHLVSDEAIPNVGALRKVLDQLNEKIENGDKLPAFLQEFSEALAGFDDGDILGTPLRSPLSDSGWASLILERAGSEAEDAASFPVPTMRKMQEYAAPAALNWRDVSEDYAAWTKLENAETKSAKDYLWTLPDGAYRCGDSIGQHELKRLTSDGGVYRSYWEYHDGCAYFQMYIDAQEALAYDGESGQILVNGLPVGKDVDKTLTKPGAAADAKAVGDAIDSLVESVNTVLRSIVGGDAE